MQFKSDMRSLSASVTQSSRLGVTAATRQKHFYSVLRALERQEESGSHGFLLVPGGRWHEAPLRLRVCVRAVMQTGMPAKSCKERGSPHASPRRERQERTHNGHSSAALMFPHFWRHASARATTIGRPGSHRSLAWSDGGRNWSGRRCKETWGSHALQKCEITAINKAKEEQNKGCCLLPVGLLFWCCCFFWSRPNPAKRNLAVLRQRNEPRLLITYLTYQMCLNARRSRWRKAVLCVHLEINTGQIINRVSGSFQVWQLIIKWNETKGLFPITQGIKHSCLWSRRLHHACTHGLSSLIKPAACRWNRFWPQNNNKHPLITGGIIIRVHNRPRVVLLKYISTLIKLIPILFVLRPTLSWSSLPAFSILAAAPGPIKHQLAG